MADEKPSFNLYVAYILSFLVTGYTGFAVLLSGSDEHTQFEPLMNSLTMKIVYACILAALVFAVVHAFMKWSQHWKVTEPADGSERLDWQTVLLRSILPLIIAFSIFGTSIWVNVVFDDTRHPHTFVVTDAFCD